MAVTSAKVATSHSIAGISEMLRAFGESKPDEPAAASDTVALAPVETSCDVLKAAAVRLMAELATMKRELQAEREEALKERDRFRDFLRTQRRLLENHALVECHSGKAPLALQCGALAEAEAVFAAQRRL
jgi:DNA-binding SARP family transcriptional activator